MRAWPPRIRRHRCGEPACCALGGGVDERHDGVLAQGGGVCARPLLRPFECARQLAQLPVHRVETRELLADRLEVLRQLHDVRVDELQSRAVGAQRHVAERAVESPLEQVEAPIQGGKRRCRVDVRQRALQQGGDVGKARLEPGPIMGRYGLRCCRLGLSRPFPSSGRPCLLPDSARIPPPPSRRPASASSADCGSHGSSASAGAAGAATAARASRCPSSPRAAIRSDRPAIPCSMRLRASARCSGSPSRTWPTSRPNWTSRSCMSATASRWCDVSCCVLLCSEEGMAIPWRAVNAVAMLARARARSGVPVG